MATAELPIDQWAGFNHKASMQEAATVSALPGWVPQSERRRLQGYLTAAGYHELVARNWLPTSQVELAKVWREWGDAPALSDRVSAATLGDDITLYVEGADATLPESPLLPPEPADPGELTATGQRILAAKKRVWEAVANAAIDEWEQAQYLRPRLQARQREIRQWALDQGFEAKLREAETEFVTPLGDAVMVYDIVPGGPPKMKIWAPDSYFPRFPDGDVVEFPDVVHLAYQYEVETAGQVEKWLRRVTYEIVEQDEEIEYPYAYGGVKVKSRRQCLMSDGAWQLSSFHGKARTLSGLENLSDEAAVWATTVVDGEEVEVRDLPLPIHFMPVVHLPSDLASITHFGRSIYVRVAQLLDEIASNDTSGARAADLTGLPVLSLKEGRLADDGTGKVTYRPGTILEGVVTKIDMSDNLNAITQRGQTLRKLMSAVSSVPEGILGHLAANQLATGISILLTFTPFRQLITRRRLARKPKVDLLLEFQQRLAIVSGYYTDPEVYPARVEFGAYIPTDLSSLIEMIASLADRGLMTESLAMTLIQAAGLEVGDVEVIVADLRARRVDEAASLVAIAGRKYAQRFLGIDPADIEEEPEPEPVVAPGVPDDASQREPANAEAGETV